MYAKTFASMFVGSMRGGGPEVFAVWTYVLANTTKEHRVELNVEDIADRIGMSASKVQEVIDHFCSNDEHSRSKVHGGKKLIREGEYQYFVVNHEEYCKILNEEDRKEYFRRKQQEYRERQKELRKNRPKRSKPGGALPLEKQAIKDFEAGRDKEWDDKTRPMVEHQAELESATGGNNEPKSEE